MFCYACRIWYVYIGRHIIECILLILLFNTILIYKPDNYGLKIDVVVKFLDKKFKNTSHIKERQ